MTPQSFVHAPKSAPTRESQVGALYIGGVTADILIRFIRNSLVLRANQYHTYLPQNTCIGIYPQNGDLIVAFYHAGISSFLNIGCTISLIEFCLIEPLN